MFVRSLTLSRCALFVLAVALICGAGVAEAQTKIAVIDVQRVVTESAPGKAAQAELEKLQSDKRGELEALGKSIQDLKKRLDEGRLSLAQDKLESMSEEYEAKVIEFRRGEDDANRIIQSRSEKLLGEVEKLVLPVIGEIGQAEGYTVVLNKFRSGLLYADPSVDITDRVIAKLASGQ